MHKNEWKINEESGQSLSQFLKGKLPGLSTNAIKVALNRGGVTLNGRLERFGSTKVGKGDSVTFIETKVQEVPNELIPPLYEDDNLLFYNKPCGISSEDVAKLMPRYFLVHRLDKETSGALLFAKSEKDCGYLESLFRKRLIEKSYIAICDGKIEQKHFEVKNHLVVKAMIHGQKIMGSAKEGLSAETHFEHLGESRVLCRPKTGRMHQIRVHLSELGHPIKGDALYGGSFSERLMLHALELKFKSITGKEILVRAPCEF